jgi:hypothetical protein
MEQRQKQLEFAHAVQKKLADLRGLEKLSQQPQLATGHPGAQTVAETRRGGGEAGLRRVIGGAKKMKAAPKEDDMCDAHSQGRMLAEHFGKMYGGAYMAKFMEGYKSHQLPAGGQTVAPGAVAPMALGGVPQAPESFRRGDDPLMERGKHPKQYETTPVMEGGAKPKRANARAQAIGKLMREQKMSMAEANKYIKEHGY